MTLAKRLVAAARVKWQRLALIAAINTGIALALWVDDARPFWHPLVTAQTYGFCIAWFFNLLTPWKSATPIRATALAALLGTTVGFWLVIVIKQYPMAMVVGKPGFFFWTAFSAFVCGLFVCLFFLTNLREAQNRVDLERAETERQRFARVATDARLEALQAQVQPHFLFNSLGTLQVLIDIDPPKASKLLGHLSDYLRSSLVEVKARTVTLGPECQRVLAFLEIMQIRLGPRLSFVVTCPDALEGVPFPPHLLTGLAENAIKHGIEIAGSGSIEVTAEQSGNQLQVSVRNRLERPLPQTANATTRECHGLGHRNVRETLATLYGNAAHFEFKSDSTGATATIVVPM
jgi:sensor histidine kinase YesM